MNRISRRNLITTAGAGLAVGAGLATKSLPSYASETQSSLLQQIQTLPNISGHEHWGSIDAIGWRKSGYVADLESDAVADDASIIDILFDPYSGMALSSKGVDRNALARNKGFQDLKKWFKKEPATAWSHIIEILDGLHSTGWFTCLDQGFRSLYSVGIQDLLDPKSNQIDNVLKLDNTVRSKYQRLMDWYPEACKISNIEKILRPVQLEFGFNQSKRREYEVMSPLLRIDHFCDFYSKPTNAMRFCVDKTGIDPKNADQFREFLAKCFSLARQAGFMGTKQLQAYKRPLNFERPNDSEVCFEATDDRDKRLVFGNFVVYECAALASEYGWSHQIHVGTHNVPDSNPLPLKRLIHDFPKVNFVLLHCWPFIEEAAYLAKSTANVFIDPCWSPILSLEFFEQSMETYIGYLPDNKVAIGHDSTSVEMAAGSLHFCRKILARVLQKRIDNNNLSYDAALALAKRYLADNAKHIYNL